MKRVLWLALLAASCQSGLPPDRYDLEPPLATSSRAPDFDTYGLRRIGMLPFAGDELSGEQASALRVGFLTELAARTPYEVVPLDPTDLDEVESSEPVRRGHYQPSTIIELARRYRLDGLLVGTVTHQRAFQPQQLALEVELVATETGRAIWSSSIVLDAGDQRVQKSILVWCHNDRQNDEVPETPALTYLSPARFARFAAHEVARVL